MNEPVKQSDALTATVLAAMRRTPDERLREITTALAGCLHDFVRRTRLTEEEFRDATALLAEMGRLTTDSHNEFVLMAGSLGVSSLVCLINNGENGATETSQNLLGPFWRMNSPRVENGGSLVRSPVSGPPMLATLTVVDASGRPVAGAEVDVWHCSGDGLYENQEAAQADMNLRGKLTTNAEGKVWFRSVKPVGYPIPTNGVVGRLLKAQGRHPFRPAHVHALVFKPGFKTLISQIYADDDPNLATDAQFGVTPALTARFKRHDEPGPGLPAPWHSLDHTLVLEPGEAKLPRAPIK
jgi:catechol 1,2-dioxygenase